MPPLTSVILEEIDTAATRMRIEELRGYVGRALGERVVAYLVGAADAGLDTAAVRGADVSEARLREGYRVVRMIETPYDSETAKAWLFGTNTRLGDRAPIEVLVQATTAEELADVRRAARQFATAAA